MKKAQGSVIIAAILVILCIALVLFTMIWIILKPEFSINYKQPVIEKQPIKNIEKSNEIICPSPYINVGNICCLDSDYNRVCDKDETENINNKDYDLSCESPYIRTTSGCCLDKNDNNRCDYDDYDYYDTYNSDNTEDRFNAYLNSPFTLYDYGIRSDEITLWVKNKESYIVTIKSIEIDECDESNEDVTLDKNERKKFDFNCDRDYNFDRDITITYFKEGSNETKTSSGNIERNDYNYD